MVLVEATRQRLISTRETLTGMEKTMREYSNAKSAFMIAIMILGLAALAFGKPPAQPQSPFYRTEILKYVSASDLAWDCEDPRGIPIKETKPPLPKTLFRKSDALLVTPRDGRHYTTAIWSPRGDLLVFVAPTTESRTIATPSIDPRMEIPVGVSINELWGYELDRQRWFLITQDGAKPRFSPEGNELFFLTGGQLMSFDTASFAIRNTGIELPQTAVGLLRAQPLATGTLLGPTESTTQFSILGQDDAKTTKPDTSWNLSLSFSDQVIFSPNDDHMVVNYGKTLGDPTQPTATILLLNHGERVVPLLKNCYPSGNQAVWSPDSTILAYPVLSRLPEITIYDTSQNTSRSIQPDDLRFLNGLSFSPDADFLVFSSGDLRQALPNLWIATTNGRALQAIGTGILPKWSPVGQKLLYALPGSNGTLDWYLVQLN